MLTAASALTLTLLLQNAAPARPAPVAHPWSDDRPFTHLFQNLGEDIRHLAQPAPGLIFAAGGGAALAFHPIDDNVDAWALRSGTPGFVTSGRVIGDGWTQAGAAVGTYAVGLLAHNDKTTHTGSDLIRAQVLTGLITQAIKVTVDRQRPRGGGHAFPSGHSSAAFATAAIVQSHFGWRAGLPLYGVASFVGLTRVRERAHWVTDTVVGAAIGIGVGESIGGAHRRAWTIVPAPTRGGMAVAFTWRR